MRISDWSSRVLFRSCGTERTQTAGRCQWLITRTGRIDSGLLSVCTNTKGIPSLAGIMNGVGAVTGRIIQEIGRASGRERVSQYVSLWVVQGALRHKVQTRQELRQTIHRTNNIL